LPPGSAPPANFCGLLISSIREAIGFSKYAARSTSFGSIARGAARTPVSAHGFTAKDFGQRLLEFSLGVADVERCDACHTVSRETLEPARAGQSVVKLGIDEVFDCLAKRFCLSLYHCAFPHAPEARFVKT
jgi:hypothetical protein